MCRMQQNCFGIRDKNDLFHFAFEIDRKQAEQITDESVIHFEYNGMSGSPVFLITTS